MRRADFEAYDAGGAVLVGDLEGGEAAQGRVGLERLGPDEGYPGEGVGVEEGLGRWGRGGWEGDVEARGVVVDGNGGSALGDVEGCAVGGPEEAVG